jgi:hypothetical protein
MYSLLDFCDEWNFITELEDLLFENGIKFDITYLRLLDN